MDSSPIALPTAPAPLRRPPLPFIAAVVPVAAGVVLWLVTGSLYALCFAALGPLMMAASLIDGARSRRRERRENDADLEAGWNRADRELVDRQDDARARLWHRYPDAASCIGQPPLRGAQPPGADTDVVIGRGAVPSGIRTSGGEGARARDFDARCATIPNAPVRVLLGRGLCVRGARPLVAAVARGLVTQLCLRFGSGHLALVGEDFDSWGIAPLPHADRVRRGAFRLGILGQSDTRTATDAAIWLLPEEADVPEGITTVIDLVEPGRASVRTPERTILVAAEGLSRAQMDAMLRGRMAAGADVEDVPSHVALRDLAQRTSPRGLPATVGSGERGDVVIDIVEDGPHAIVTGMTGTGKSELLVTWVTAMAQVNGPERVSFVLADFKGGTAFEPLRTLRQVAAVITDLDEGGARRGVSSLTAELRRREALLARAGARDVSDIALPRLVIVVDEFAALLQEHPDLCGLHRRRGTRSSARHASDPRDAAGLRGDPRRPGDQLPAAHRIAGRRRGRQSSGDRVIRGGGDRRRAGVAGPGLRPTASGCRGAGTPGGAYGCSGPAQRRGAVGRQRGSAQPVVAGAAHAPALERAATGGARERPAGARASR